MKPNIWKRIGAGAEDKDQILIEFYENELPASQMKSVPAPLMELFGEAPVTVVKPNCGATRIYLTNDDGYYIINTLNELLKEG